MVNPVQLSWIPPRKRTKRFCFLQASKFSEEHLDERIEAFFSWFLEEKLANMDPAEYQQNLDTLVKLKKEADVRLGEEVSKTTIC